MNNKILSTLNIGNNSYEIDDAFARQKIEEVDNNLLKINPTYSASGSVVSFDNGADNLPLEELIVDINPVQDLHGYDYPWIGGCGKNLLKNKLVTSTINDVTATVDEKGIVTLNGTATGNGIFDITTDTIMLPSKDSYIVSGGADGGGSSTYRLYFEYYNYTNEAWNGLTCTSVDSERPITTDQIRNVKIQVFNNTTCDNIVFKPMLRKATETDTTFEPYENICPITGWTGMNVQRCGKNLLHIGSKEQTIGGITFVQNEDGTITANGTATEAIIYTIAPINTIYAKLFDIWGIKADVQYVMTSGVNGSSETYWLQLLVNGSGAEPKVYSGFSTPFSFTTEEIITTTHRLCIRVANGTTLNNVVFKPMICLATETNTTFEPYIGTEIPINWESEAGTVYGGNLNILTGMLTVDRAIVDIDNLTKNGYTGYGGWYYMDRTFSVKANNRICVSCNLLQVKNSHSSSKLGVYCEGGVIYFEGVSAAGIANNLAECTDWLKQSNIELILPLAEPVTYQLTPHEVKSLLGQNNIFTDINSNNILVTYKASVQKCIDRATTSIPYGQVDATSTSTNFTATIDGITELRDGVCVILRNGVVTSASGFTININNLGAKPVYSSMAASTRETTIFNSAYTVMLIYSTSLDNGNGGWWFYRGYNSDTNTTGYVLRTNSMALPLSSHTHRYRLLFTSADGTHFVPANNDTTDNTTAIKNVCQEKIDPFGTIRYYNGSATLEAEEVPSGSTIWEQNTFSLGYSFNRVGGAINLAIRKPVYIKALPQSDGSAIIDADEPYVQDLPTTEDGFIYIYLGSTYSASNMELTSYHPVYYYHNGAIRPWLGFTDSEHIQDIVSSVNGKTGTVTLTAEDVGAMQGMTILSYGHSTWAEFLEAYESNRIVYCKASSATNPATGLQGRMAFFAYFQSTSQGYSTTKAEFQYYRSVSSHTVAQQGDQVFCYTLRPENGGTWSVEARQASSRVIAGTGLASAYTKDNLTLSLDADYKDKIDTLWADYQSRIGQ